MPKLNYTIFLAAMMGITSCEKMVEVEDPIDSITTNQVFSTDDQASAAMAGVYSKMINDVSGIGSAQGQFSSGLATVVGGCSADELTIPDQTYFGDPYAFFVTNKLLRDNNLVPNIWNSAYTTIYNANAIIEGIAASTSARLTEAVRKKLTAESKFVRAFSYFYLVNFFGDVPLVMTVDFNKTRYLARTPKADVYKQIIRDLLDAQADLPPLNTNAGGEKIFPGKWAATAMLARAYLFTGDHENAFKQSSATIANNGQLVLEEELSKVFLKGSREAIWQLKHSEGAQGNNGNATPEGALLIPGTSPGKPLFYNIYFHIHDDLLNAFEPGDDRFNQWLGVSDPNLTNARKYFVRKYQTGIYNRIIGGTPIEYYMPLRLAEQYFIRAEAAANGAGTLTGAIDDLNEFRRRAGLEELPYTLSQPEVLEAIAQEKRIELFAEWSHRWFDLKRTGKASSVLSQLPSKQPWAGDYQLLYPIPLKEMLDNKNLTPNPGYY